MLVYYLTLTLVFVQVAQEIWVCEKQTIRKWQGGILSYKEHLKTKMLGDNSQSSRKTPSA